MKNIRVGVIGLGYWGPNLVRNFLKIPGVQVTRLCDISSKNLSRASHLHPTITTSTYVKDLISDSNIDLIAIATPLKSHYNLAMQVLSANKHVLIEKPMTENSKQAESLIQLAKKNKKMIFVGHTFVYSEPIKYLKEIISKNELGKLFYYDSTRINLGLLQSDSNVLWDLAPHDLSIISYLFKQKPITVQAVGSSFLRQDVEELVHVFLELEENISCHIELSWLSPVKVRTMTIAGSKKMATYNDIEPSEKIKIFDKGVSILKSSVTPFSPAYRSGKIVIPNIKQEEALFTELSHFVSCIRTNKPPKTGGTEGLEVVRLIELLEKSLKSGKKIRV